ncbi:hypothetical protein B0T21DRAFT_412697 [Apiosordaria backusii]|uniref:Uncharacterized protein n=1 Tax=Apiosordaria backusii TaxID=314023 RepID=A0AA40BDZ3_9PEZI|nr:hypothetical protein B0T21DRAFT_412697 [Apiosordaria backusii]
MSGISKLLTEIESGGGVRRHYDRESLTYKKPVTYPAAKQKAKDYHRYFYAKHPISCGGRGSKVPLIYPEYWATTSTAVEHNNNKAVAAKTHTADNLANFDPNTTSPYQSITQSTDKNAANASVTSSRPIQALKKKGHVDATPKAAAQTTKNKPSTPIPAPVTGLFPLTAQVTPMAPTSVQPKPKRKQDKLDGRGLKRARIEEQEKKQLVSLSVDNRAATIEARKRASTAQRTPTKIIAMSLDSVENIMCKRCGQEFASKEEGMANEGTCSWHSGMFSTNKFLRFPPHGEPHIEEGESKWSCCGGKTPEDPKCNTAIGHVFDSD